MKDASYELNATERTEVVEAFSTGLHAGDFNNPPARKQAIYRAFEARDARFDGRVYAAVSSTGVYCRPVCPYHAKLDNITFYASPGEAEAAGYRPCLVCRPETAPGNSIADTRTSLARRAASIIYEECTTGIGLARLAARLGYTDRHVRRIFEEEYGITPMQFLTTCRCSLAKSLLADTTLSMRQIAQASGFKSVRRFNDAFKAHYRLTPSEQRRLSQSRMNANEKRKGGQTKGIIRLRLGYRPPYCFSAMLGFLRRFAISGIEDVNEKSYARTARIVLPGEDIVSGWIRVENDPAHHALVLSMSESLLPATSIIATRVRQLFDLNSTPETVYEALKPLEEISPGANILGIRLPGCFDAFETCCQIILRQAAKNAPATPAKDVAEDTEDDVAAYIARTYGQSIESGVGNLRFAWPLPAKLLEARQSIAEDEKLKPAREQLRTVLAIACALEKGDLNFDMLGNVARQRESLLSLDGVSKRCADHIVLRIFCDPDTACSIEHPYATGAEVGGKGGAANAFERNRRALEACRPYRSYAAMGLWYASER